MVGMGMVDRDATMVRKHFSLISILAAILAACWSAASAAERVDFTREIRPLLAGNCFVCHGPDEAQRKAGLRLDTRDGATAERKGRRPVVPGDPSKSELVRRIRAEDDDRMPPAKSGKRLTPEQVKLVERWIAEGAPYARHWAYSTPVRAPLPAVRDAAWPRHAIDRFILARLEREGLAPSPEADRYALIRRVSLDLTGLPPSL